MGFSYYLGSIGSRFPFVAFFLVFSLICAALVWFRHKTGEWTTAADATAWLARRSWRQRHPRRAKYLRILQLSFLLFPSLCSALVLFFLPVTSHILYSGAHLAPHYRFSTPLNWLIIKSRGNIQVWTFFSNRGAARWGFTPIWFNHSMPSSVDFHTSDPASSDGWWRPQSERARAMSLTLLLDNSDSARSPPLATSIDTPTIMPQGLPQAFSLHLFCGNLSALPSRMESTTTCARPSSATSKTCPLSTTCSTPPFLPTRVLVNAETVQVDFQVSDYATRHYRTIRWAHGFPFRCLIVLWEDLVLCARLSSVSP
jgi:hypothetical protein